MYYSLVNVQLQPLINLLAEQKVRGGSRVVLPTLRKQASLESWLELTEAHTHVGLLEKPYVTEVL